MAGNRERALRAGCNGYLIKPFRPAELVETLDRLTAGLVSHEAESAESAEHPGG